jgi:pyrophosphatase PpaX
MKIKALIFDVDGTLIDNTDALVIAWQKFADAHKLKKPSQSRVRALLGIPYIEIAKKLWPGLKGWNHIKEFRYVVAQERGKMKPIARNSFFISLRKKYKLGIVSSAHLRSIKHYSEFSLRHFSVVITSDRIRRHKPDPYPIILACKQLGVSPKEVLYFGDTKYDFLAAKRAGANFVGVLSGANSAQGFKRLGAKYIKSVLETQKALNWYGN